MDNLKSSFSKSLLGLLFVFSIFNYDIHAQVIKDYNDVINKYTVASPDVYNFEKYSLNPINHYVGKPEVSIPIFTIKTGGIDYPLKLVYDAGGIKVDQLASDVGLGWNLTKTIITRTINQDNDFDNLGSLLLQSNYLTYSAEERAAHGTAYNGNYTGKIGYFLQKQTGHKLDKDYRSVDFIPDTYNFYTNGFSTNFFFNTISTPVEINPKGTKIQATDSEIKIPTKRGFYNYFSGAWEPNYDLLTHDFFNIKIITPDGIKYTFSDCDYAINQDLRNLKIVESAAQISAWQITQIEDTKTGKKIDFIYENTSSNPNGAFPNQVNYYKTFAQRSFQYIENPETALASGCAYYVPYESFETYRLSTTARTDVQKKRLKQIVFDEGRIYFNYNNEGIGSQSGTGRNDIYNGDYVSQIYVQDKNFTTVNSFSFVYSTFNSDYNVGEFNPDNIQNTYRYNRLKLISVQESGKPAYKFSYEESMKLPPVNSFSMDFLGYYNHSQDVTTESVITSTKPNPTLYYYPNQFEKSVLPFPVTGMNYTTIPGIFNRQANDYAKAWSLTKVEYPTGGSSEYIYEPNEFEIFGKNIKGGGIRIASQLLKDGAGATRTINYSYLKDDNITTSGKLSSIPYFGHPTAKFFEVLVDYNQSPPVITSQTPVLTSPSEYWKLFDKSNLNADLAIGAYVGYSKVIEKEVGHGRKEFKFTSNEMPGFQNMITRTLDLSSTVTSLPSGGAGCLGEFMIANSGMGSNLFTDNSYKRGKLWEEKVFNETNQLLRTTTINYTDIPVSSFLYIQPITVPLHTLAEENIGSFLNIFKSINVRQYLPNTKTISSFDNLGIQSDVVSSYAYNPNGILKQSQIIDSNGDNKTIKYYYPNDVTSTTSLTGGTLTASQYSAYVAMTGIDKNNISEPIQIEEYTGLTATFLKSVSRQTFKIFDPVAGIILPELMKASKGTNPLIDRVTFHKYDNASGNPIEMSANGGLKTVYIWGYNNTKIVAKIENIDYSTISAASITNIKTLSNTEFSVANENSLRTALNNLRTTLSLGMVTTYTYNPLIGITSITDPRGYTKFYEYDSLNRLKYIKDALGNIISKNEYNFHQN